MAETTAAPANPDLLVPLVVRLFEPQSVTNDRALAAKRAPPREQLQRDLYHPGSVLFSASGSAIKRTTAGVKAGRGLLPGSIARLAFTLLVNQCRTKKEYCFLPAGERTLPQTCKIGRYINE